MSGNCRDCAADADRGHCHGTLIVHLGQRPECTEPDCDTPDTAHSLHIDCYAVACGCAGESSAQPMGPASAGAS